jgi:hypothetical protein
MRISFALVLLVCFGCASTPKWEWRHSLDPNRNYAADSFECDVAATSLTQNMFPNNSTYRLIAQQAQWQRCMEARGWQKVTITSSTTPQPSLASGVPPTNAAAPSAGVAVPRTLLFGGPNRTVYLGCISCAQTDPESVFNSVGTFGSRVSATSIFNRMGQYGSPVSAYSVCNPVASEPPVLMDAATGTVRARLTLNQTLPGSPVDERVLVWLRGICSN